MAAIREMGRSPSRTVGGLVLGGPSYAGDIRRGRFSKSFHSQTIHCRTVVVAGEWHSPAHPEQLDVRQVSISAFPIYKQWWGKGADPARPCVEPMNRSRCTVAGTESLRG